METNHTLEVHLLILIVGISILFIPFSVSASDPDPSDSFHKDREAILNMTGRYRVTFRFRETIPIQDGYQVREPFVAGGTEVVRVIEDEGDRITHQHFLLVNQGKTVIKHWRQVWTYEDRVIYEYQGDNRWTPRTLPAEDVKNTWAGAVFQVGDSPRYETYGSFTHHPNFSSWESNRFWRPLPRRETKKRDDYDVMGGRHRLTIKKDIWYHEQDNRKIVRNNHGDLESVLVREVGLNTYAPARGLDVSRVDEYWRTSRSFWREVRSYWRRVMGLRQPIQLKEQIDGDPLWKVLFRRAKQAPKNLSPKQRKELRRVIDRYRLKPKKQK